MEEFPAPRNSRADFDFHIALKLLRVFLGHGFFL
jgi:hypothetical protein